MCTLNASHTYILMLHVLKVSQLSIASLSDYCVLKRSSKFLQGHSYTILSVQGRAAQTQYMQHLSTGWGASQLSSPHRSVGSSTNGCELLVLLWDLPDSLVELYLVVARPTRLLGQHLLSHDCWG